VASSCEESDEPVGTSHMSDIRQMSGNTVSDETVKYSY
jgi:hypothetical protein